MLPLAIQRMGLGRLERLSLGGGYIAITGGNVDGERQHRSKNQRVMPES